MSKNLRKDAKASSVYHEIQRIIQATEQHSGGVLTQENPADLMEVSQVAVEDALTRLLGEDLVNWGKEGSYFVAPKMTSYIHQLSQVREILELAAIKLCIANSTKEQIGSLYEICDDFSSLVMKGYFAGACEADLEFHTKLVSLSGNAILLNAYNFSNIPLFHNWIGNTKMLLDEYVLTDKEHRQMVDSIRARDLSQSEKTLKDHIFRESHAALQYYLECV